MTVSNSSGQTVIFGAAVGDQGAWLSVHAPGGDGRITLSAFEGEAGITAEGPTGSAELDHDAISLNTATRGAIAARRRGVSAADTPAEQVEAIRKMQYPAAVRVASGEGGGGMVTVFNPAGKDVVSVQSNKSNAGAVFVYDATGSEFEALLPRIPVPKE